MRNGKIRKKIMQILRILWQHILYMWGSGWVNTNRSNKIKKKKEKEVILSGINKNNTDNLAKHIKNKGRMNQNSKLKPALHNEVYVSDLRTKAFLCCCGVKQQPVNQSIIL